MAYKLNLRKKNFLKTIHVLSAMAWFGGTLSLLLLRSHIGDAQNGDQLLYTLSNMHVIDETMIKYPALTTLISGILLSVWTPWGLTRYYWTVMKLVLTVVVILTGIVFVNRWFSYLVITVNQFGLASMQIQDFKTTSSFLLLAAIFNNLVLASMTFITAFKPFGKIVKTQE